jgi:hypothetical protein
VLEVGHVRTLRLATLAYGTTSASRANRGREVRVLHPDEIADAGLMEPTRFVCVRRVMVPVGHKAFTLGGRATPVLGHLTGAAFEDMQKLRARFQAERDMAAEFRAAKKLATRPNREFPGGRRDVLTPALVGGLR